MPRKRANTAPTPTTRLPPTRPAPTRKVRRANFPAREGFASPFMAHPFSASRRHDEAWLAVTTLRHCRGDPRILDRRGDLARQPLDGGNGFAGSVPCHD